MSYRGVDVLKGRKMGDERGGGGGETLYGRIYYCFFVVDKKVANNA